MRLVLVEDDPELGRQMTAWMADAGHHLTWLEHGEAALDWICNHSCDAAILDVGLPDLDGFAMVESLRKRGVQLPVIFLTARAGVPDRVRGLAAGADDYLTKPFAAEELLARLDALYRRAAQVQALPDRRWVGNSVLDPVRRRISCGDEVVDLQPREWTLLDVLMKHEGRIVPKQFLLEQVWDIHFDPGTNVVDAMICRLRRKLESAGSNLSIETIRGKGYAFQKDIV
jgi:two-component system OmpR family response regulator